MQVNAQSLVRPSSFSISLSTLSKPRRRFEHYSSKVHAVHIFLGRKFLEISAGVNGVHSGRLSWNFPLPSFPGNVCHVSGSLPRVRWYNFCLPCWEKGGSLPVSRGVLESGLARQSGFGGAAPLAACGPPSIWGDPLYWLTWLGDSSRGSVRGGDLPLLSR